MKETDIFSRFRACVAANAKYILFKKPYPLSVHLEKRNAHPE